MNTPKTRHASITILFIALWTPMLSSIASANADQDQGWRLRLTAAAIQPTVSGGYDLEAGFGLGVGYRFSRRLSVDLDATHGTVASSVELLFIDTEPIVIQSEVDTTPVLARLNVHLTPNRKMDLYAGVAAGWMRTGDLKTTVRGEAIDLIPGPGSSAQYDFSMETSDSFAWGAHVGLDRPLSNRGAFFTSRLTYLQADIALDGLDLALDPLVLNVGIGFRF